jgi:hypothetical protein
MLVTARIVEKISDSTKKGRRTATQVKADRVAGENSYQNEQRGEKHLNLKRLAETKKK